MTSIRSSRVVLPEEVRPATVHFDGGLIVEISDSTPDLDVGDLVVMPGLVDSHVHVNEPGRTEWEGFETATKAAVAGGTTTIVDMPLNSIPPTTTTEALEVKRRSASGKLSCDVAFWGGIIPGSESEVQGLVSEGVSGFKAFMVDSGVEEFPPVSMTLLEEVLPVLKELGVPLLLHAEDPAGLLEIEGEATSYTSYLDSRPAESEAVAITKASRLAAQTDARVHILHVSSGEAAEAVADGPAALSGETCPHYLTFCAEEVPSGATAFKCAPPIRSRSTREELWDALVAESLSMIVSDHSPAPPEIKSVETGNFVEAWGGVGSLQLRLQAVWTGASQRSLGFDKLARWLAFEPAQLAGISLSKGSIEVGKDADLVVFDPGGSLTVEGARLHHRHPTTPYEGMALRGTVAMTILRGQTVFEDGKIQSGMGRMLKRDG